MQSLIEKYCQALFLVSFLLAVPSLLRSFDNAHSKGNQKKSLSSGMFSNVWDLNSWEEGT